MPTKIRQGKYIDKDGIETDVAFIGAEKAIFDDNNVRLDNKLVSMSKASGLTAEDTEGMLGTAEENVNFQLLIDAIAEKVMNELVTNSALTSQLANYVTKAMMSNAQVNDQNKVPTSALAYLMNQQITENENAITQLNSDLENRGSILTENSVAANVPGEYFDVCSITLPDAPYLVLGSLNALFNGIATDIMFARLRDTIARTTLQSGGGCVVWTYSAGNETLKLQSFGYTENEGNFNGMILAIRLK